MTVPSSKLKVVLEPAIEDHDPALYHAKVEYAPVAGWEAVDDARIEEYRTRGFLVIRQAFSASQIEAARVALESITRSEAPQCKSMVYEGTIAGHLQHPCPPERPKRGARTRGEVLEGLPRIDAELRAGYVRKISDFCAAYPPLQTLATQGEMLSVLGRIVGEPAVLFQEMALVKPPGGREKPWHQDHAYFDYPLETPIVGVWIAIDQVDVENGCMVVLPGGHLQGPRLHFMRRDYQICDSDMQQITEQQRLALPMEPGDLLLFDGKLPHGTPTNKTAGQRWAVQYHYVGERARVVENKEAGEEGDSRPFGSEGKNATC